MQALTPWIALPVALFFVAILSTAFMQPYGIFHDELYYLAGTKRLSFGYVDHPPLSVWILAAATRLFGESGVALLVVPAACGAGVVLISALLARRFGGGRTAQLLATSIGTAPFVLTFASFYSVNALELFAWAVATLLFAKLLAERDPRLWIALGLVLGLGLLDKHTVGLLCVALGLATLCSPLRQDLRGRWPWIGAGLALLVASPNFVWNALNGFPSWSFYSARGDTNLPTTIGEALTLQLLGSNVATASLWIPGAVWLLVSKRARPYRPLGLLFAGLLLLALLSGHRRGDRIAGIYPIAIAAGAVVWEQASFRGAAVVRRGLVAAIAVFGLLLLPFSLPVLAPENEIALFDALGIEPVIEAGDGGPGIPLHLLGQLDWEAYASEIAAMVDALPRAERDRAAILTPHWAYAAVLEYYEPALRPIVSPHNAYWFWRGEGSDRPDVIAIGVPEEILAQHFAVIRPLGTVHCRHCAAWRPDQRVVLARRARRPLAELLDEWKHFGIQPVPSLSATNRS